MILGRVGCRSSRLTSKALTFGSKTREVKALLVMPRQRHAQLLAAHYTLAACLIHEVRSFLRRSAFDRILT
jgi:hypothetical protein